jgi:exonuclease SbcC
MIIETVKVRNFLSHGETEVDFREAPMWLVCGENGAGKSALFDAVEYALYGAHRGDKQDAKFLVKHGTDDALVQIVVRLDDGCRYRVTRHLSARDGNKGGSVEELDEAGELIDVVNAGAGVRAAWAWLERRLPPHTLFRSAVLLRQGETAHFMKSSAGERMKYFAALIGLDRYTAVAARAAARKVDADRRRLEAQAKIDALQDVSDEAWTAAQTALDETERRAAQEQAHYETARVAAAGAEEWHRLQVRQRELEQERAEVLALLADEETIRNDHAHVSRWDQAASRIGEHWRARQEAAEQRSASERARAEAVRAAQEQSRLHEELTTAQQAHTALVGTEIPQTRRARDDAQAGATDLGREAEIAAARAALEQGGDLADRLAVAQADYDGWAARRHAIPYIHQLAEARRLAADEEAKLKAARAEAEDATADEERAAAALGAREAAYGEASARVEAAAAALDTLEQDCARLEGRISRHRGLTGEEGTCPTCAQPLDAAAHVHVREMLREEQAALDARQAERAVARSASVAARAALGEVEEALKHGRTDEQAAQRRAALAREEQARREQARAQAGDKIRTLREQIEAEHPAYAEGLKAVTPAWARTEDSRVKAGMAAAQRSVADLSRARERLAQAEGALTLLRSQRRRGVEPLGDAEDAAALRARANEAALEVDALDAHLGRCEAEARRISEEVTDLTARERVAAERVRLSTEQADTAAARAIVKDAEADQLAAVLGPDWSAVLESREAYAAEQLAIERRRESAKRIDELTRAHGRLDGIGTALAQNANAQTAVPAAHRLTLDEARSQEVAALAAWNAVSAAKASAENAVRDLEQRRASAAAERGALDAAATEAETYGRLAEMLKEGGPVQNLVAEQEQRAIAEEVNAVLGRLNDGLQVVIGGARRARATGLQDIKVRDTTDPRGEPRHFEFLSGGEQFRVAVALALALHRRVGRRVGTLVIDEGFGALDSNRRDALAQEMANQAGGILQLGYAQSIVICSHSTEVQRHFTYRWEIRKRDGVAGACRPDVDAAESYALPLRA